MRLLRFAVVAVAAFASGSAYAFHDGGVAACDGCHVMHNASNGQTRSTIGGAGQAKWTNKVNPFLLQGADQSSTCLNCHGGQGSPGGEDFVFSDVKAPLAAGVAPANYTPGGDFGWLTKNYSWVYPWGQPGTSPGQRHGHSIIAKDFGLTTIDNNHAPGGAFMTGTGIASLACSNCHDPHGRYRLQGDKAAPVVRINSDAGALPIVASGSYWPAYDPSNVAVDISQNAIGVYRLLAGKNYRPVSNPGFPFQSDPPLAIAPTIYNQQETTGNEVRVAYGQGMGEWCANCHNYIHLDNYATGADGLVHPAGNGAKLRQAQADIYNSYKGSGDLTATPTYYMSIVPFETQVTNLDTLGAASSNKGTPGTDAGIFKAVANQSNVMCLSCHRAHASAWDNMLRWNMNATFVTVNGTYPGPTDTDNGQGRQLAETTAGYYGRSVGAAAGQLHSYNRSLCNKCHAKD